MMDPSKDGYRMLIWGWRKKKFCHLKLSWFSKTEPKDVIICPPSPNLVGHSIKTARNTIAQSFQPTCEQERLPHLYRPIQLQCSKSTTSYEGSLTITVLKRSINIKIYTNTSLCNYSIILRCLLFNKYWSLYYLTGKLVISRNVWFLVLAF